MVKEVDAKFSFSIPWNPFGSGNPETTKANTEKEKGEKKEEPKVVKQKEISYPNEFVELYNEFVNNISLFRDRYPITTLITMVFFAFLGFSIFFHFSLTAIITCAIFCTFSACIGKSIQNKGNDFWISVKDSIFEIFQSSTRKGVIEVNVGVPAEKSVPVQK